MTLPSLHRVFPTTWMLLVALLAAPALAQAADPVEELRLALPLRLEDMREPTPAVLKYRENTLKQRIADLRTIGQLRRALTLFEWKEDPNADARLRRIDGDMRSLLAKRLTQALRAVVEKGDATSRLAVANLIAEMGANVRSVEPLDARGFARTLTPLLIALVKDKDPAVRQEALRALGNVNAPAEVAVPVLRRALEQEELEPRRVAAASLLQMVKVINHLQKRGRTETGVEASKDEVLATCREAVLGVTPGLADPDPQIRGTSLEIVQLAAQSLADLILDPFRKNAFPPPKRPLNPLEKKDINAANDLLRQEFKLFEPFLAALKDQVPRLAEKLDDPEPKVKRLALHALESIGNVRLRLAKRLASVPAPLALDDPGVPGVQAKAPPRPTFSDPLESFIKRDLPAVVKLLKAEDVRLRRSAVDLLEILEEAAAPVAETLIDSLNDPDRFVRWSAARTLATSGLHTPADAAPGLAKLLSDPDLNVRLAAAETLEQFGPPASEAVPALARALAEGDVEGRVAALYALMAMGPEHGKDALPNMIAALKHADPRVRRVAAEVLGSYGPLARSALPALRRALSDEDPEVRVNASDALLNIAPAGR